MADFPAFHRSDKSAASDAGSAEAAPVSSAQVHNQVERILDSPLFASSESLRAFLRFTVERTLEGRGDELKEYVIGVEVFRRGAQFDPRLDSIVRVQGSKVRSKLREYYESLGQQDPVWIELPKGSYVPIFRARIAKLPDTTEP